jgi:hypothetical protein
MPFKFVQLRALGPVISSEESIDRPDYDPHEFLDFSQDLDPEHAKLLTDGRFGEIDDLSRKFAKSTPPLARRMLLAISNLARITAHLVARNPHTDLASLRTSLEQRLPKQFTPKSLLEHEKVLESLRMTVAYALAAEASGRDAAVARALLRGVALLRMVVSGLDGASLLKPVSHGVLDFPDMGPVPEDGLREISRMLNDLDEVEALVRISNSTSAPSIEHLGGLKNGPLRGAVQRIESLSNGLSLKKNVSLDGVRQILLTQADVLKRAAINLDEDDHCDACNPKRQAAVPRGGAPRGNVDELPKPSANVRVLGRGDLMLVRRQTKRYQLGDIAHVENIMAGSGRSRTTELETETIQETESFEEELVDTSESSLETSSMNIDRATEEVINTHASVTGQASVAGGFGTPGAGPFSLVSVGAAASASSATENSNSAAVSFAKSVTEEATKRVRATTSERRLSIERRKTRDVVEQTFTNASGDHIKGVYRWVDKIEEFQIYNYGEHLLLEMIVPEPATQFLEIGIRPGGELVEPPPLCYTPDDLTPKNYLCRAAAYGVTGLQSPPPFRVYVADTITVDPAVPQEIEETAPEETVKWAYAVSGKKIEVPAGYAATTAHLSAAFPFPARDGGNLQDVEITFGTVEVVLSDRDHGKVESLPLVPSLEGPIAIGMATDHRFGAAVSVRVVCTRTETAMKAWRQSVYDQIAYSYRSQKDEYNALKRQQQAFTGTAGYSSNAAMNREIEQRELKRECQTLLTDQHFDHYGALDFTADDVPRIDIGKIWSDAQHIQFFEECFQWEHMAHYIYPYQWAGRSRWEVLLSRRSDDAEHQKFLQAGAARVIVAVRPGYEKVVSKYLKSGHIPSVTGESWRGASIDFPPVVELIADANDRPGDEIKIGEPWEVTVPTLFKYLQTSSNLNDVDSDQ